MAMNGPKGMARFPISLLRKSQNDLFLEQAKDTAKA